jgi:CRISPR-associated protein Cmr2
MSFDLFASLTCDSATDVDNIVRGRWRKGAAPAQEVSDVHSRIKLLSSALRIEQKWDRLKGKDYARDKYQGLVLSKNGQPSPYVGELIAAAQQQMQALNLWQPEPPDFSLLSRFSAFLQFQFRLTQPYLSRDDELFHVNDNPVKKDAVFKVPMVSPASWKGNLRWTMMKTDLEPLLDDLAEFARRRLRHTLLFGTESGFESARNWEAFLDHRCATEQQHYDDCQDKPEAGKRMDEQCRAAREQYRALLREGRPPAGNAGLPHLAGWLRFYPTFFDGIGLEVINPHDRATRAGKQPIYFESVPIGASGVFSLLYAPQSQVSAAEAKADLQSVAEAVSAMMLTYGFSAKKTSGFGEAADDLIEGYSHRIYTNKDAWPLTRLSDLREEVGRVEWD